MNKLFLTGLALLATVALFRVSTEHAYAKVEVPKKEFEVMDIVYNVPIYFDKGGAMVLLPNNKAVILNTPDEVDEYAKIKEAAVFSETYGSEIGSVSDLTADAFLIKYKELGGKFPVYDLEDGDM